MNQLTVPSELEHHAHSQLQVAVQAATAGAQVVLDFYRQGVQIRSKDPQATYNLVSDADVQSEQAVARVINERFPEHAILGEEEQAGDVRSEHLWIVDPLDGTNNFAHQIPHFAVSIAYYHQGRAVCGLVVNPARDDWYWAVRDQGAFCPGRRLRVSSDQELNQAMVGCGFYYDRGAMMEATLAAIHDFFKCDIHGIRRFGTAALDLCHVADGLYGAFFEYQLQPWDFAAARLILEEAGGRISDGHGHELPLATTSVLATNGLLHDAGLAIVERHHPRQ